MKKLLITLCFAPMMFFGQSDYFKTLVEAKERTAAVMKKYPTTPKMADYKAALIDYETYREQVLAAKTPAARKHAADQLLSMHRNLFINDEGKLMLLYEVPVSMLPKAVALGEAWLNAMIEEKITVYELEHTTDPDQKLNNSLKKIGLSRADYDKMTPEQKAIIKKYLN